MSNIYLRRLAKSVVKLLSFCNQALPEFIHWLKIEYVNELKDKHGGSIRDISVFSGLDRRMVSSLVKEKRVYIKTDLNILLVRMLNQLCDETQSKRIDKKTVMKNIDIISGGHKAYDSFFRYLFDTGRFKEHKDHIELVSRVSIFAGSHLDILSATVFQVESTVDTGLFNFINDSEKIIDENLYHNSITSECIHPKDAMKVTNEIRLILREARDQTNQVICRYEENNDKVYPVLGASLAQINKNLN
ncbi:MAG: hypothetical protein L3J52_07445 [Proteobacteria bacterium]|nr:hypothetical protein [Pseudomonadota bacterium]